MSKEKTYELQRLISKTLYRLDKIQVEHVKDSYFLLLEFIFLSLFFCKFHKLKNSILKMFLFVIKTSLENIYSKTHIYKNQELEQLIIRADKALFKLDLIYKKYYENESGGNVQLIFTRNQSEIIVKK